MKLDSTGEFIKNIRKVFNLKNKKILEVGCGTGRITKELSKYALGVVAIEPDLRSQRIAENEIKKDNVKFYNLTLMEFLKKHENESFDLILFGLSFHHLPPDSLSLTLEWCFRILNKKGYILIIEPDRTGTFINLEERFNKLKI